MNRRSFLQRGVGAACAHMARAAMPDRVRPNILVVIMDDLGRGGCAPYARTIEPRDFDPAFVNFLREKNVLYTPEEALDMARSAMPRTSELARRGVVFSNAFASSNLCAPSRAGLLSGCLQNRWGFYQNTDVERTGIPPGQVLAERLQSAGYATALIGKWHCGRFNEMLRQDVLRRYGVKSERELNGARRETVERAIRDTGYLGAVVPEDHPLRRGFDYYFGYNRWECPFYNSEELWENWEFTGLQERYNTELFTEKAIAFMKRSRAAGKPFFVHLAYHAVHGPLQPKAPERHFNRFPSKSYDLTNFYAHVSAVDDAIGQIRSALGDEWTNTLLIFCSDNGAPANESNPPPANAPYRGQKGSYYQGGIRVPLLVHWPSVLKGGQVRKELVSLMDVMPTALEAAAVRVPEQLDGRSLLPLLQGKARVVHEELILAGIHARAWGFMGETTIGNRQGRREESPGAWVVITDGRYMLRYVTRTPAQLFIDVPDGVPAHYELYDVREDPGETRNLITKIPQTAEGMKAVYTKRALTWPPPTAWRKDLWQDMVPEGNVHRSR